MFRIIKLSLGQIGRRGKFSIIGFSTLRILISFLDLIGIGCVGLILTLALHSQSPDTKVGLSMLRILRIFQIGDASLFRQLIVLGCLTAIFFLLKIVLTLAVTFAGYRYLVTEEVRIAKRILGSLFSLDFVELQKIESAKVAQLITHGTSAIIRIVGYSIAIASDLFSLTALIILLGYINPLTMICSVFFFGGVSYLAIRYTGTVTETLSQRFTFHNLLTTRTIQETYFSYKELAVSGKFEMFQNKSIENKRSSARAIADIQFLGAIPRAVLELSLVFGIVIIVGVTWISAPSIDSLSTIGIFLAASSKLIPALANLMASMSAIMLSAGEAQMLVDYLESDLDQKQVKNSSQKRRISASVGGNRQSVRSIRLLDVSFSYPRAERQIFDEVALTIEQGDFLLVSGPSGIGKSTLVDLILGLLQPSSGSVEINGINATVFRETNMGSMAYVPQVVSVIDSTILENVIFGYDWDFESEGRVIQSLKDVDLWTFVQSLPKGVQTQIGERGATLSGGQRQRLGIARALYQEASLIVFDESTNALDAATEGYVHDTLSNIRGTTIIIIANGGGSVSREHRKISINDGKLIEKSKL